MSRGVIKKKVAGKEITLGAVLASDGSSKANKTGSWRAMRPVVDTEKCTACGMCWSFCPEGCIHKREEHGKFTSDLDYCKGCGICANVCPVKAITMVPEEK